MAITHIEIIIEQIGGRINGFINSSCFFTDFSQIYDGCWRQNVPIVADSIIFVTKIHDPHLKEVCVFPMAVVFILPQVELGPNDHRMDSPCFKITKAVTHKSNRMETMTPKLMFSLCSGHFRD